jgi:hypothetical protein
MANVRSHGVQVADAMARLPTEAFARTKKMLRAEFVQRMEAQEDIDIEALTSAIPAG